ncbi:MAG TPA: peptide chain release factor N(5)-glutamine methyltransferase [Mycobacteriales bacterium]|nr:peptide chain release factor N(5)-glutamine methyltransferase [Mycobacteriales bacterium]
MSERLGVADLRTAAQRLALAGVASAEHDARRLVEYAAMTGADLDQLVERRAAREPLQHIVGSAGFRHLELQVGPGVFVPRPETEVVVEAALAAMAGLEDPVAVDLCAGSGAVGLSIAREHPTATVHLVERDPGAFEWLQRNAPDDPRVRLHLADAADALGALDGTVDVVVSNPPYVAVDERDLVDPEVRDHDPAMALWAGADGLDVIRVVQQAAMRLLRPAGRFVVEHSDRQGETAPALLRDAGWCDVADHLDLTGRPRFTTATKPC